MKTSIIDVLDGTKKSIYSTIGQNFTIGKQWGSEQQKHLKLSKKLEINYKLKTS